MNRTGPEAQRANRARGPGPRRPPLSRRWMITGVIALSVSALIVLGLLVVYPRVGAWMIRDKLGDKVGSRLGRELRIGSIDVSLGHAELRDLQIRGPNDG